MPYSQGPILSKRASNDSTSDKAIYYSLEHSKTQIGARTRKSRVLLSRSNASITQRALFDY